MIPGAHDLECEMVECERTGALQYVCFVIAWNRGAHLLDDLSETAPVDRCVYSASSLETGM